MVRVLQWLIAISRRRGNAASMARVLALRSLAIGVNVLTGLLTAAVLGPAGRGEQTALTVAPQFLAGLATLGLHASFIYNVKADPQHEREYLGANLVMLCLAGIVVSAVGWVALPYWLTQYSPDAIALARMFLCTAPFTCMTWTLLAAAEARGLFNFANRTLYLQSLVTLAMLLVLAWLHLLTPGTAGATYMIVPIPAFLYFAWHIGRMVRPTLRLRPPFPRRLLHYGLRFYGVDLLATLSGYLDQVIIVALLAPELVGIYSVALSTARMLTVLQTAVGSVLFPSVAARSTAVVVERVAATLRVTSLVTALAALAMGLAGPYLLTLLYGPRFASAVTPFQVLLLDTLVASSARILYLAFSGSGRPEWVTGFEMAGVMVSVAAMLVLVPRFGLTGAAFAVLLASSVRLACGIAGLRLVLRSEMPRLLLSWSDVQAGLRALGVTAPVEDAAP